MVSIGFAPAKAQSSHDLMAGAARFSLAEHMPRGDTHA